MPRTTIALLTRYLTAALVVTLATGTAHAHDADGHVRIKGDKVVATFKGSTYPASKGNKFIFLSRANTSSGFQLARNAYDPTVDDSSLVVRSSGTSSSNTGVLHLNKLSWRELGNGKGWSYKGSKNDHTGVSSIKLFHNGSLSIKAKGSFWPFEINDTQDSVEVLLHMGVWTYCAKLDGAETSTEFKRNEAGRIIAAGATPPVDCPSTCGNGIIEIPEECDDGNTIDDDGCSNACALCDAGDADFASTYEGLQAILFDGYDCSNDICHGATLANSGLDLRDGVSYDSIVNVASQQSSLDRVEPGDQDLSFLYNKIAAKTLGSPDVAGSPMPANALTVTEEHLEALRLWIRGGAPRDTVVEGTAELLGSCLPPPSPRKIPALDPPAPEEGVQFLMPAYPLDSQDERELCIASFYDLRGQVPEGAVVDCPGAFPGTNEEPGDPWAGKCFTTGGFRLGQDPQSHHSIINIYAGDYDFNEGEGNRSWDQVGGWRCYDPDAPNDASAATCDPSQPDACPSGQVCATADRDGTACLATSPGYGPPDASNLNGNLPTFSGSQESLSENDFPATVYGVLPLRGIIVWNSHAFNLTQEDMRMEAYLNIFFEENPTFPSQPLFNDDHIFIQDVPPGEVREYCYTHTFPEGARLFDLSSHAHRFLSRWRYFAPPQTPCTHPNSCPPGNPANLFYDYESFDYSDALTLKFDPPVHFTGAPADRTFKFCALYDNGATNPNEMKRQSTSPTPDVELGGLIPGGPCDDSEVKCTGGENIGELCFANDSNCPLAECDACNVKGGVTTDDEMFIAIGTYYVDP